MEERATLVGFEPTVSTLKGWRAGPLHHRVSGRKREYRTSAGAGPSSRPAVSEKGGPPVAIVGSLYTRLHRAALAIRRKTLLHQVFAFQVTPARSLLLQCGGGMRCASC